MIDKIAAKTTDTGHDIGSIVCTPYFTFNGNLNTIFKCFQFFGFEIIQNDLKRIQIA